MRVNGRWWRVVSLGLSLGVGWGSLSQAQPNARIPETPLLAQATPRGATTIQEQIRELEAQIEAARRRGDQAEVERLQADLQVLRQGTPVFNLQQVTVTGTRTERTLADSPATITVIDRERLRQELIQNIQDLVRYEPGVSVRRSVRYGLQDFNIRGLDANRVLIQVDGIRQPERFSFGPFTIGRDTFELETLKTVEIIRGPASTLYGSDALGGCGDLYHPGSSRSAGGTGQPCGPVQPVRQQTGQTDWREQPLFLPPASAPLNLCIRTLAIDQHRENLSSFAQEESLLRPRNPLRLQGRDGKLSQVGQASLPSFIESQTQQNVVARIARLLGCCKSVSIACA